MLRRARRPRKVTLARWAAWRTLSRTFDDDAWTDRTFAAVCSEVGLDDDPRERAFAQRLAYGTVQSAKRLDHVIGVLGKRPLHKLDPPVLHALRIGTYELLELQQLLDGGGSSSAHAAVDQAVELVRGVVGERAVAFTNAILRRAQVDGANILAKLDESIDGDLATLLSMPEWLVVTARESHGQRGIDALAAQNIGRGGGAFRAGIDRAAAIERCRERGADVQQPAPGSLAEVAADSVTISGSTAAVSVLVDEGVLVPQSIASQLVTLALDPQPGERILDMCAAPGGKTTHIASRVAAAPGGAVVAIELHEHRASSVRALATRTGLDAVITVRVADATMLDVEEIGTFDRVLVDAPCSGTGVLAARPDARWRRTQADLDELVVLQRKLLDAAARLVRPGGVVVYSTCSILQVEDEHVADQAPSQLVPDPLPAGLPRASADVEHLGRTWPQEHETDGFFIARFRRTSEEGDA